MKASIIIYSETGVTRAVAESIAQAMQSVPDTEVRIFNIAEEESWDGDYIRSSRAVLFGTPTYYANLCWQMKKWFDTRGAQYGFGGKLGSAFATENNPFGGGAELAIMTIYNHLLVYGMLVYSSGVNYGRPPVHIGPTIPKDRLDSREEICTRYGTRIARKMHELFDHEEKENR